MIAIVDYGMGNLRNVQRAWEAAGGDARVTSLGDGVRGAGILVLPGVGAFGEAIRRIDRLGLREPILAHVASGKPLMGICLGMQLLFDASDESPGARGLGVIAGSVRSLAGPVKIPHIGWNDVSPERHDPVLSAPGVFYFVHSYAAEIVPETVAITTYGAPFAAAVRKENVFGVQFHPEKSQHAGLALVRRFVEQADSAAGGIS
jgi:imidazole glycerol phosphate synthase glutamine amidotransferase subunit